MYAGKEGLLPKKLKPITNVNKIRVPKTITEKYLVEEKCAWSFGQEKVCQSVMALIAFQIGNAFYEEFCHRIIYAENKEIQNNTLAIEEIMILLSQKYNINLENELQKFHKNRHEQNQNILIEKLPLLSIVKTNWKISCDPVMMGSITWEKQCMNPLQMTVEKFILCISYPLEQVRLNINRYHCEKFANRQNVLFPNRFFYLIEETWFLLVDLFPSDLVVLVFSYCQFFCTCEKVEKKKKKKPTSKKQKLKLKRKRSVV